ncbi:RnfABCDGE type electron transport complex subunit B [Dethiobacter alkaliphilus]|uniref:RnfABCDGE type electron transport complex subunit B n=1 Tax=Dethiobacter alkaliphilus TaxID=427926 RepID=UPI0022263EFC|nr:RnfABCDGE type electron transport complex subunit B [Dethiobacter alkaliphilus]MCW3491369.1 RnfABCDGE type electron transport complex subunit B [Dethiobacter alkaliphilus]
MDLIPAIASLGGLGLAFGGALAFASQKFAVEVDPKVEMVQEMLLGANCGACGYAGCAKFAEEVVAGKAPVSGCTPGGASVANKIAEILGAEAPDAEARHVAQLTCAGDCATAKEKHQYHGVKDCKAALMFSGGPTACSYGCLGLGNCERVCPVDAITMSDKGLPIIDVDACISCGKCKNTCPRQVIELVNAKTVHHVRCKSRDKGKQVKEVCERGCIACNICVKKCPVDAIRMENNIATIDSYICNNCGTCVEVCPRNTIE